MKEDRSGSLTSLLLHFIDYSVCFSTANYDIRVQEDIIVPKLTMPLFRSFFGGYHGLVLVIWAMTLEPR